MSVGVLHRLRRQRLAFLLLRRKKCRFGRTKLCSSVIHRRQGQGGIAKSYDLGAAYCTSMAASALMRLKGSLAVPACAHVCAAGLTRSCHPVAAQAFAPTTIYAKYPLTCSCLFGALTSNEQGSRLRSCPAPLYNIARKLWLIFTVRLGAAAGPSTTHPALLSQGLRKREQD